MTLSYHHIFPMAEDRSGLNFEKVYFRLPLWSGLLQNDRSSQDPADYFRIKSGRVDVPFLPVVRYVVPEVLVTLLRTRYRK